jgi:small subunit ribosomal protein S13
MKTTQNIILELRQVFGAKGSVNKLIVKKLGSNPRIKKVFLPEKRVAQIERYVKKVILSKKLPQQVRKNINFLKTMRSYRGVRHKAGLPVRGQRTQTNAKTAKKRGFKKKKV